MSISFNIFADPMPNTDSSESTQDHQGGSKEVVVQADVHAGPLVLPNDIPGELIDMTEIIQAKCKQKCQVKSRKAKMSDHNSSEM